MFQWKPLKCLSLLYSVGIVFLYISAAHSYSDFFGTQLNGLFISGDIICFLYFTLTFFSVAKLMQIIHDHYLNALNITPAPAVNQHKFIDKRNVQFWYHFIIRF